MFKCAIFVFSFFVTVLSFAGSPTVLLTGGTGYIGSHIAALMLKNGYEVVLVDNLANSRAETVQRIEVASGKKIKGFVKADLLDEAALEKLFHDYTIDAVIHLAGLKSVSESMSHPLRYYETNLGTTINLLKVMQRHDCNKLVFSSSATVYGAPQYLPIDEKHPVAPTNPYGQTKLMIEQILTDTSKADAKARFVSLRYFNPIGAHESGVLGEKPKGVPQNLMPYILDVVAQKREYLNVYGSDYDTKDGTAVRDYIHIMDVADAHEKALEALFKDTLSNGHHIINIGTGKGYTVLEMVAAVSKAWEKDLPYVLRDRRPGDIAAMYADASLAKTLLGFEARLGIDEMMRDSLRFSQSDWFMHDEL